MIGRIERSHVTTTAEHWLTFFQMSQLSRGDLSRTLGRQGRFHLELSQKYALTFL